MLYPIYTNYLEDKFAFCRNRETIVFAATGAATGNIAVEFTQYGPLTMLYIPPWGPFNQTDPNFLQIEGPIPEKYRPRATSVVISGMVDDGDYLGSSVVLSNEGSILFANATKALTGIQPPTWSGSGQLEQQTGVTHIYHTY